MSHWLETVWNRFNFLILECHIYDMTYTTVLYRKWPLLCLSDWWPSSSVSWFYFTSTPRVRTRWCLTDRRKRWVLARGSELNPLKVIIKTRNLLLDLNTMVNVIPLRHSCHFVITHCDPLLLCQISPLLTSEVHSVRAGRHLATKLNILVQQHFDLASTTITNIPMKVRSSLLFNLALRMPCQNENSHKL